MSTSTPLRRLAAACAIAGIFSGAALAQVSNDAVRIGFITDMSGPYADTDGLGGLEARVKPRLSLMGPTLPAASV